MHELSIMSSALTAVLAEASRHGAHRVHRIVLAVGALSGADPASLRFAFEAVSAGTLASGATLDIDAIPARAHCAACGEDFAAAATLICECPRCRGLSGEIRAGRELAISRLEMS